MSGHTVLHTVLGVCLLRLLPSDFPHAGPLLCAPARLRCRSSRRWGPSSGTGGCGRQQAGRQGLGAGSSSRDLTRRPLYPLSPFRAPTLISSCRCPNSMVPTGCCRIVLDEAHTVKNSAVGHSKACAALHGDRRWMCTGGWVRGWVGWAAGASSPGDLLPIQLVHLMHMKPLPVLLPPCPLPCCRHPHQHRCVRPVWAVWGAGTGAIQQQGEYFCTVEAQKWLGGAGMGEAASVQQQPLRRQYNLPACLPACTPCPAPVPCRPSLTHM